jgi:hypothetical protein
MNKLRNYIVTLSYSKWDLDDLQRCEARVRKACGRRNLLERIETSAFQCEWKAAAPALSHSLSHLIILHSTRRSSIFLSSIKYYQTKDGLIRDLNERSVRSILLTAAARGHRARLSRQRHRSTTSTMVLQAVDSRDHSVSMNSGCCTHARHQVVEPNIAAGCTRLRQ